MRDVYVECNRVDPARLRFELKAALGGKLRGMSIEPGVVIVHLDGKVSQRDMNTAFTIVAEHVPQALTHHQRIQITAGRGSRETIRQRAQANSRFRRYGDE